LKEKIELNSNAVFLRKRFGVDSTSPIEIMPLVHAAKNITLVFHPFTNEVSGMSYQISKNQKLIAINSTMSYGRQRFTIAHELYHLNFQENFKFIICGKNLWEQADDEEKNADAFASFFLAPFDALRIFINDGIYQGGEPRIFTVEDIVKIEQYFGMSRQATLYRLCSENFIKWDQINEFKNNVIGSARKLGYDDQLYRPTPAQYQIITTGSYLELLSQLDKKGILSKGKVDEYLLDAYREDIVYNIGNGGEIIDD
jgi:Zn-dependent peptidase ImmA (M78 family)